MLGVALIVVTAFLWVWSVSKKERAVKKYTEVKKQVEPEAGSRITHFSGILVVLFFFFLFFNNP